MNAREQRFLHFWEKMSPTEQDRVRAKQFGLTNEAKINAMISDPSLIPEHLRVMWAEVVEQTTCKSMDAFEKSMKLDGTIVFRHSDEPDSEMWVIPYQDGWEWEYRLKMQVDNVTFKGKTLSRNANLVVIVKQTPLVLYPTIEEAFEACCEASTKANPAL